MNILFQTPRLYFREFTEDDVQVLFELNSDYNVTKYLHEPAKTIVEISSLLNEIILPEYEKHNYGRWAVHLKSNDEFIGWCGFKYVKETDDIDLTYRFKENSWGNGYGFEAARATLDYGLNTLELKKISARALPQNIASLKILEKCAMQYVGDVIDDDGLMVRKYENLQDV